MLCQVWLTENIILYILKIIKKLLERMSLNHDIVTGREDKRVQAKLVGLQRVSFFNNNGEKIEGKNIFCAFKDENVEGLRTEKFFLKDGIKLPDCKINDTIEISFNMKGKVEMLYKA